MRNVSDKSCRENRNTYFVFSSGPPPPFPPKILPFMRKGVQILNCGAGRWCQYSTCALHARYLRLQTHTQAVYYWLFLHRNIAVARTRLIGTLYVHRLSRTSCLLCDVDGPAVRTQQSIYIMQKNFPWRLSQVILRTRNADSNVCLLDTLQPTSIFSILTSHPTVALICMKEYYRQYVVIISFRCKNKCNYNMSDMYIVLTGQVVGGGGEAEFCFCIFCTCNFFLDDILYESAKWKKCCMCRIFTVIIACADLVSFLVVLTYQHNSCLERERESASEREGGGGWIERVLNTKFVQIDERYPTEN